MLLWDLDFARSPEDRVGALFWRRHRCARILFSLGFHLGEMTPEEGIDLEGLLAGIERSYLEAALERTDGHLTNAAKLLGISFRAIRYKVKKYGLT